MPYPEGGRDPPIDKKGKEGLAQGPDGMGKRRGGEGPLDAFF